MALIVPKRNELLATLTRINRWEQLGLVVEGVFAAVFIAFIANWSELTGVWLTTLILAGIACFTDILGIIMHLTQNALPLREIRTDKRVGKFSRDELVALADRAATAFGLSPRSVTVYLTRDKSLNASAFSLWGAGSSIWFGRVYLHRALLYVLSREELYSVLLHEFAHLARYYSHWMWATALHVIFRICLVLAIFQLFPVADMFFYLAILIALGIHQWIGTKIHAYLSQPLEYLCDDAACELGGVLPHVTSSLKLGVLEEAHQRVLIKTLELHRAGSSLSLEAAMRIYEEVLPFGQLDAKDVEQRLEQQYQERDNKAAGELSVRGFFEYIGFGSGGREDTSAVTGLYERLVKFQKAGTLAWPRERLEHFTSMDVRELVRQIEAQPDLPLFGTESEHADEQSSHPSHRQRIVYAVRSYSGG